MSVITWYLAQYSHCQPFTSSVINVVHRDLKIISLEEYWFVAFNLDLVVLGLSDLSLPLIAAIITDYILWWIVVCVNWVGKEMPRKLAKHYFFVFLRIFLKEISIWIIKLNKEECPFHVGIMQSFEGGSELKMKAGEGRGVRLFLSLCWVICFGASGSYAFGHWLNYIPDFPGPLASQPSNCMSQSL